MKYRHHRRALPARGDVGGAEVVDHGNAEPRGERRPVAELHGQSALGPMQHGLAVEAHHGDRARRHPVRGEEGFDRLGMHVGHQLLGLGEQLGPIAAVREIGGDRDRSSQHAPLVIAIGPIAGRAEAADILAVGVDERHVDPVVGGAAHQADGWRAHELFSVETPPDLLHHRAKTATTTGGKA
jgi:hypothetical protein